MRKALLASAALLAIVAAGAAQTQATGNVEKLETMQSTGTGMVSFQPVAHAGE